MTANGSNTLTFDNNGNETTDENGQTTTYDAWNRAITVKNAADTTIASYSYDPTGRRITEAAGGVTTAIYFTNQWQDIEERQAGTVTRQNVWGLGYVNQLVERDDDPVAGNLGVTGSGLGERLYAQQDANWNVTALVDASGDVVERMVYSPYGTAAFLTSGWAETSDDFAQNILFQGGRLETATGNYVFEHRDYQPAAGVWAERDPRSYVNGADVYKTEMSEPVDSADPTGLTDWVDAFGNFLADNWLENSADSAGVLFGTGMSDAFGSVNDLGEWALTGRMYNHLPPTWNSVHTSNALCRRELHDIWHSHNPPGTSASPAPAPTPSTQPASSSPTPAPAASTQPASPSQSPAPTSPATGLPPSQPSPPWYYLPNGVGPIGLAETESATTASSLLPLG